MPRIPTYESRATLGVPQLTPQAPAIKVPTEAFGEEARALSGVGKALANVGERLNTLQANNELYRANTQAHAERKQIEFDAMQDTELSDFEQRYNKRLQDSRANILKTIRNPLARRQFELEYDRDLIDTQFRFKILHNKLVINQSLNNFETEKEAITEAIYNYTQPEQTIKLPDGKTIEVKGQYRELLIDRVASRYNDLAKIGAMETDTAAKEFKAWRENLTEGQAEYDILANPTYTLGELQKGEQGIYKNMAHDKRIDLIKQAETRNEKIKNRQEEVIAFAKNQREADIITMKVNADPDLTESFIKDELVLKQINPQFADTMISALRRPKKAETKSTTFNKLVDYILNPENKQEAIRLEILKENAKGELSDEDMNILYTFNKQITITTIEDIVAKLKPKGFLQQISFWSDEYADDKEEVKATMYKNYMQHIKTGEDPEIAVKNTISAFKKMTIYDIGQILSTPRGQVKVIGYDADGEPIVEPLR